MTSRPTTGRRRPSTITSRPAGSRTAREALFQSVDRAGERLTGRALSRRVVLAMIKRRAAAAGLPPSTCCHTFRATGITAYLSNGGTLEHAQQIAGHASPKTTKLYDRTADTVTVDEIERIVRCLADRRAPGKIRHTLASSRLDDKEDRNPARPRVGSSRALTVYFCTNLVGTLIPMATMPPARPWRRNRRANPSWGRPGGAKPSWFTPSSPLTTPLVARRVASRLRPDLEGSRTLRAAGEHCAAGSPVPTRAGSSQAWACS